MASSLLDELPCLLDEADELMARFAFFMKLLTKGGSRRSAAPVNSNSASCLGGENLTVDGLSVSKLRECLSSSETESALKFFAKQFLTSQPVPVEKMHAQLQLQLPQQNQNHPEARNALLLVAKKVFHLMKRIHHWQRAAWGILTQFFAESAYLTFAKHRLLTALLLNTLTKYVKVHLLWTSCQAIPSLLSVHTFSQYLAKPGLGFGPGSLGSGSSAGPMDPSASMYSPLDHVDHHLREYVLCFGSSPLFKIQQDFQQHPDGGEIARNLSTLAISCFESFIGCHDLEQLRNQGVFDIESFSHGNYAALGVYEDLLFSHEQEEWVVCVALCLPQQLKSSSSASSSVRSGCQSAGNNNSVQLWDFVHVIAQDRLVLPVFRDFAVNLHTLLYQQIASTLSGNGGGAISSSLAPSSTLSGSSSSAPSSLGQSSLKKLVSALSKQALRTCAEQHAQRAQFAKWLLQSCSNLLTQCAALVAPLFPVLLGACRVARDEIEWLLCHEDHQQQLLLPAHVKPKHLARVQSSFAGNSGICGDLLVLTHRLRALVQQNVHFVKDYYEEFLTCGDADAIAFEIQALLDNAGTELQNGGKPVDPRVEQILRSFAVKERYRPILGASNSGNSSQIKVSPWRREWRQLSVTLLSSSSQELPSSLLKLMERACSHSKYVESATSLLDFHAQISKWWWFASLVEKLHQQLLLSGGSGASPAIAMLEIIEATICGDYALGEIVEEAEAQEQGILMQGLYLRMENAIGVQLGRAIDSVVDHEAALHTSGPRLNQQHPTGNSVDHIQGSKSEKSRRESRVGGATSSSSSNNHSSFKSSEYRFPSAISSMRGSSGKTKPGTVGVPNSFSSGPLGPLAKANEALYKLASAIHTQMVRSSDTKLAGLVERHVRLCIARFLRGLVEFSDLSGINSSSATTGSRATAASAGPSSIGCGLRCSLQHAAFQLQCYVNCVQKLFRNATFVNLTQVVLDTLASEREGKTSTARAMPVVAKFADTHQWTAMQSATYFYTSMLQGKCAPLAQPSSANSLIASRRKQSFVFLQSVQLQTVEKMMMPEQFTSPAALRSLREIVGSIGIKSLGASIVGFVCSQVQTLRQTLEQDQIALIRFDKSSDAPYSELAMAVKQMARLEDFVTQMVQIGLHLFFAGLLQQVEPSFSIQNDLQWQQLLNNERGIGQSDNDGADRTQAKIWKLLPVAFAASFHSDLWRRSKYLEALDATDTNAHMSCTAMLHLLQLVHDAPAKRTTPMTNDSGHANQRSSVEPTEGDGGDNGEDDDGVPESGRHNPQYRALLRHLVTLSSQSALGLRAASKELPSPAMLTAVRMLVELAGEGSGCEHREEEDETRRRRLEIGILDQYLPDIVFQMCSSARVG